jgi:hypothetical protein
MTTEVITAPDDASIAEIVAHWKRGRSATPQ